MSYYDPASYNASNYSASNDSAPNYSAPNFVDPSARRRPGTVTAAGYLLYGCAGLAILGGITAFSAIQTVRQNLSLLDSTDANTGEAIMGVYGGLALGAAVLLAICAMFIMRGRQWMRVTTWVVAGLGVLCLGCGSLSGGANLVVNQDSASSFSGADSQIANAIPHWYYGTTASLEGITVLALFAVIILIALPGSSPFFRQPTAFVLPPGYPMMAGYPQAAYPAGYQGYTVPPTAYPTYPAYPQTAAPWIQPAGDAYPPAADTYPPAPGPAPTIVDQPINTSTTPSPWQPPSPSSPPDAND